MVCFRVGWVVGVAWVGVDGVCVGAGRGRGAIRDVKRISTKFDMQINSMANG